MFVPCRGRFGSSVPSGCCFFSLHFILCYLPLSVRLSEVDVLGGI